MGVRFWLKNSWWLSGFCVCWSQYGNCYFLLRRGFVKFAVNSLAEADSLIGVSDTLLSSLSGQMHLASQEMRAEAQRYAEEKKAVERMLVKVSRSEANELRAGLRELDAEYRQKLRDFDQFMRERIRQSEQLLSTNNRSAVYKKEAEKGLREVERRMMELQLQLRPQTQPSQEQASIQ